MTGKVQLINCLSADDILHLFKKRELFQDTVPHHFSGSDHSLKKFSKLTLSLFMHRDLRRQIKFQMKIKSSHIVQNSYY